MNSYPTTWFHIVFTKLPINTIVHLNSSLFTAKIVSEPYYPNYGNSMGVMAYKGIDQFGLNCIIWDDDIRGVYKYNG